MVGSRNPVPVCPCYKWWKWCWWRRQRHCCCWSWFWCWCWCSFRVIRYSTCSSLLPRSSTTTAWRRSQTIVWRSDIASMMPDISISTTSRWPLTSCPLSLSRWPLTLPIFWVSFPLPQHFFNVSFFAPVLVMTFNLLTFSVSLWPVGLFPYLGHNCFSSCFMLFVLVIRPHRATSRRRGNCIVCKCLATWWNWFHFLFVTGLNVYDPVFCW